MSNELNILNELLYEYGLENRFQFCYITNGDMESISLEEFYYFGFSIQIYNNEEGFDEEIEIIYEAGDIYYEEAVIAQVRRNLKRIVESLNNIVDKIC